MLVFFFNEPATTEIYTLSLHDALPIYGKLAQAIEPMSKRSVQQAFRAALGHRDRKSTRLNSSHVSISYAVFCLKKKNHCGLSSPPTPSPRAPRTTSSWPPSRSPPAPNS